MVFTPNLQSTEGALEQIARATTYRRRSDDLRPLVVYPLPSRIEIDLKSLQERWRFDPDCGYQPRFEELFKRIYGLERCDLTDYFNKVQVPQVRDYAYGEQIAVLVERGAETFSLTSAYAEFTARLLSRVEPWTIPESAETRSALDEALRRAYAVISQLSPADLEVAKRILIRLVLVGKVAEAPNSARTVARADFGEAEGPFLAKLLSAGLIEGEERIALSEPALAREWAPLTVWIDEDREFLRLREVLDNAIDDKFIAELFRDDGPLAKAAEKATRERPQDFNLRELEFLAAIRRASRTKRWTKAALSFIALVAFDAFQVTSGRRDTWVLVSRAVLAALMTFVLTNALRLRPRWIQSACTVAVFLVTLWILPGLKAPQTAELYRVKVALVAPDRAPITDAKVLSSSGGELKKTAGGWEVDIPAGALPLDHRVTFFAESSSKSLSAQREIILGSDHQPAIEIQLIPVTTIINGRILDDTGLPVPGAIVRGTNGLAMVISDARGVFSLPVRAALGDDISLLVEKAGYRVAEYRLTVTKSMSEYLVRLSARR